MDVTQKISERPEDLLDAMARGDENLGERLLKMARGAAAADRASILDLLLDDNAAPQSMPVAPTPISPAIAPCAGSLGGEVVVVPGVRVMEAAR